MMPPILDLGSEAIGDSVRSERPANQLRHFGISPEIIRQRDIVGTPNTKRKALGCHYPFASIHLRLRLYSERRYPCFPHVAQWRQNPHWATLKPPALGHQPREHWPRKRARRPRKHMGSSPSELVLQQKLGGSYG
jgi:hypothetical protein